MSDLTKEEFEQIIVEDFIEDENKDVFKESLMRFCIAFNYYEEDMNPIMLSAKIDVKYEEFMDSIEDLDEEEQEEEKDKFIEDYKEKLDYEDWGMSLIYSTTAAQSDTSQLEEDTEDLSYIG